MAKFLLCWELGANLGHVIKLRALARELSGRGDEVVAAVRDLASAADWIAQDGLPVYQAPIAIPQRATRRVDPFTYAEILALTGYADASGLYARVRAWRTLIDGAQPDVLVADASPTALLAARGTNVRRAMCGIGFFSPPRVSPFPSFRVWERTPVERASKTEAQVLRNVNRVLGDLRQEPLEALHEILKVDEDFVLTLPELDHYEGRSQADYWGPVFDTEAGEDPRWPEAKGKRVFVYLRPHMPGFAVLARELAGSDESVLWFAPGMEESRSVGLSGKRLRFSGRPFAIRKIAQSADVAVTYAGHGTVAALLLGGIPQLLLPTNAEQLLLARKVEKMGAGIVLPPDAGQKAYGEALRRLVRTASFATQAKEFAEKYRSFSSERRIGELGARLSAMSKSVRTADVRSVSHGPSLERKAHR